MSSGHGKYVRGASDILDEVNEARRVVDEVAKKVTEYGKVEVYTFHDNTSKTQQENLETIVNWHNDHERNFDVSIHFNCYEHTSKPMGSEVLYITQEEVAADFCRRICDASGLKNRGAKKRTDLFFLNNTEEPALLFEICFVDSMGDAELYNEHLENICQAIAQRISMGDTPEDVIIDPSAPLAQFRGKASWFGGPRDGGVSSSEGLAFIQKIDDAPQLFLPYQPKGTTGLARRLNPYVHYVACRWNYNETSKERLLKDMALVTTETGLSLMAWPADWGPHEDTGRVADLSPALLHDLGLKTDGWVDVVFPAPGSPYPTLL